MVPCGIAKGEIEMWGNIVTLIGIAAFLVVTYVDSRRIKELEFSAKMWKLRAHRNIAIAAIAAYLPEVDQDLPWHRRNWVKQHMPPELMDADFEKEITEAIKNIGPETALERMTKNAAMEIHDEKIP